VSVEGPIDACAHSPTLRILFIPVRSIETPPYVAEMCPSSDEPAPNGMTGVPLAAQILTTCETSSVDSTNATASGGVTLWYDSSVPCCCTSQTPMHTLDRHLVVWGDCAHLEYRRRRGQTISQQLSQRRNGLGRRRSTRAKQPTRGERGVTGATRGSGDHLAPHCARGDSGVMRRASATYPSSAWP
jgi:hypothetical protein